uniref:Uncharacterized protein n=1 Tax=Ditylenchus dipsaci TaxID=166011 RepID=A0A915CM88_9BILA
MVSWRHTYRHHSPKYLCWKLMFLQHIPIGLLLMWQLVEWSSVFGFPTAIHKRQVSLDDLIHTALKIVQPIFRHISTVAREQPNDPKRITADHKALLGSERILHTRSPTYSALRDVPICRGNSQICRFISCTAHNFKHDQNFANLNLAAQLIGDQKFRKTISSNPEAIHTVCQEQGLSSEQCRLFSRGFQLIDRFMGTIEKPASPSHDSQLNQRRCKPLLSQPLNDMPDPPPPLRPIQPANQLAIGGSRTWSTHINADLEPASKQNLQHSPKVVTYEEPTMRETA